MQRRAFLGLMLSTVAAPVAADDEACGPCGPKGNPRVRAQQLYQMALASDDPAKRLRLARLALRVDPTNAGAQALVAAAEAED